MEIYLSYFWRLRVLESTLIRSFLPDNYMAERQERNVFYVLKWERSKRESTATFPFIVALVRFLTQISLKGVPFATVVSLEIKFLAHEGDTFKAYQSVLFTSIWENILGFQEKIQLDHLYDLFKVQLN
jgi:hypothetical protein